MTRDELKKRIKELDKVGGRYRICLKVTKGDRITTAWYVRSFYVHPVWINADTFEIVTTDQMCGRDYGYAENFELISSN